MVFGFLRFGVFGVLGFWGLGFRVLGFIGFRFWGLGVLVDFLGRCKFLLGGFCFIFLIGSGIFFGLWLDMRFFLMNFLNFLEISAGLTPFPPIDPKLSHKTKKFSTCQNLPKLPTIPETSSKTSNFHFKSQIPRLRSHSNPASDIHYALTNLQPYKYVLGPKSIQRSRPCLEIREPRLQLAASFSNFTARNRPGYSVGSPSR